MDEVHEECGIFGVYLKEKSSLNKRDIPVISYYGMSQIQHRGQLSAGVCSYNDENLQGKRKLAIYKEIGRVNDLFSVNKKEEMNKILEFLSGKAIIGHVRYSTSGKSKNNFELRAEAQPFFRNHPRIWKKFGIIFNGHVANYDDLKKDISYNDYVLDTDVDTEIIMNLISLGLNKFEKADIDSRKIKPDFFEVFLDVAKKLDGAYSMACLFADGDLVLMRDAFGFKPLVYGENEDIFAFASESTALEKIGITNILSLNPGECLVYNKFGMRKKILISEKRKARCQFEWIYFSNPNSVIDGKSVNSVRENLGKKLAEIEILRSEIEKNPENYVVVPVPNTAIPAAEAMARALKIDWSMALNKIDSERGFINKEEDRKRIMNRNYNVIKEKLLGKKIILVEDSIVRGETSKKVITLLREAGAKEVHLRSTEPRIMHPCCYGIDMASYSELIANKYDGDLNKIAKDLGADSVLYLRVEDLKEAIGFDENDLCLACLNGDYPTEYGKKFKEQQKRSVLC